MSYNDVFRRLGARLATFRDRAGLTQEALAAQTGYSAKHISNLELGKNFPSAHALIRLTRILDVSVSELFLGVDRPLPTQYSTLQSAFAGRDPLTQEKIMRVAWAAMDLAPPSQLPEDKAAAKPRRPRRLRAASTKKLRR